MTRINRRSLLAGVAATGALAAIAKTAALQEHATSSSLCKCTSNDRLVLRRVLHIHCQ